MENQVQTTPQTLRFPTPESLVVVAMVSDGVTHLQRQLERDITAKILDWRPIPFTVFDLIAMAKLLPSDECVNMVMTHADRKILAQYCAIHYRYAREAGHKLLAEDYDEFLTALLEESTLITFQL